MTKRKFIVSAVGATSFLSLAVVVSRYLVLNDVIGKWSEIAIFLVSLALTIGYMVYKFLECYNWFSQVLDHIEHPLSITDSEMNWTFINKPVEGMLNVKRSDMLGKHCSNWGAKICNTEDCGVNCLRKGSSETFLISSGRILGSTQTIFITYAAKRLAISKLSLTLLTRRNSVS